MIILLLTIAARAIGIAAGVLTSIAAVPQLIKVAREKKAEDVSVLFLLVLVAGLLLWIWYAWKKEDYILLTANAFSALVNLLILFFKFRYGRSK